MPPSSLIFVVILAVWAAYLIQHWVRRRDHIATARSVDRFSEAMRVLERRQRGPRIDLSTPAPRSYAVSPARPAHPEVVVKRAQPAPGQPSPGTAPLSGARGRGTTLLLASLAMVLGTALGVLEVWPLWTVAAGVGAFVLTLAVVRTSVRRSTSRHELPPPVRRQEPTRRVPGPGDTTPSAQSPPGSRATRSVVTAAGGAAAALAARESARGERTRPSAPVASATSPRPHSRTAVFDVELVEQQHRAQSSTSSIEHALGAPGGWAPVPVPRPTYTMKAKASPPHTGASRAPTPGSAVAADIPFDGYALAFDEESEELPAVHSLG